MHKRISSGSDMKQAEQRSLEKTASHRRIDAPAQEIDIDRHLSEPTAVTQVASHVHFSVAAPLAAPVPVHQVPNQAAESGPYVLRRLGAIFRPGLSIKQRLRAIPLLGYGVSILSQFVRAPLTRQQNELRMHALQQQLEQSNSQISQRICGIESVLQQAAGATDRNFAALETRLQQLEKINASARLHPLEMLNIGHRLMKLEQIEADRKIRQFSQLLQFSERENLQLRAQIHELASQVDALTHGGQQALFLATPSAASASGNEVKQDDFFRDFEEAFRGSKDEIKQRLQVYLPYLKLAQVAQDSQVIDVGCGRGEWLELLAENQIPALGVDLNAAKVEACIAQGLAAKVADAIAFLRAQEAGSVAAVTGFHIIEHLPFETLLALFDAAHHALRPGGLIIFETPNPENLLVGACNFYFDPTHLHPIVPAVAQFIAQQRGFVDAEIIRLHPYPEDHRMRGDSDADAAINRYFFGPQDYALIARK